MIEKENWQREKMNINEREYDVMEINRQENLLQERGCPTYKLKKAPISQDERVGAI